jgi:hypothetical protein
MGDEFSGDGEVAFVGVDFERGLCFPPNVPGAKNLASSVGRRELRIAHGRIDDTLHGRGDDAVVDGIVGIDPT